MSAPRNGQPTNAQLLELYRELTLRRGMKRNQALTALAAHFGKTTQTIRQRVYLAQKEEAREGKEAR